MTTDYKKAKTVQNVKVLSLVFGLYGTVFGALLALIGTFLAPPC